MSQLIANLRSRFNLELVRRITTYTIGRIGCVQHELESRNHKVTHVVVPQLGRRKRVRVDVQRPFDPALLGEQVCREHVSSMLFRRQRS